MAVPDYGNVNLGVAGRQKVRGDGQRSETLRLYGVRRDSVGTSMRIRWDFAVTSPCLRPFSAVSPLKNGQKTDPERRQNGGRTDNERTTNGH